MSNNGNDLLAEMTRYWHARLQGLGNEHDIDWRVVQKIRTSQLMVFRVALSSSKSLRKALKLDEEMGLVMGLEKTPRVARDAGLVNVEVVLPEQFRRTLPLNILPQVGQLRATVGQTVTGRSFRVKLNGTRTCHHLISGTTGSGKTVLEWLLTWAIVKHNPPRQVKLILIDGKGGVKWQAFKNVPHLMMPVIGDAQDAVKALAWTVMEMDKRKRDMRNTPAIFVVIDEVRDLITVGGDDIALALDRLTAVGREFGIHVIAATQKALTDSIGGSIAKANFPVRWCGYVPSAQDAHIATGQPETGANRLNGLGDFIFVAPDNLHRVQVALLEPSKHLVSLPRMESETDTPDDLNELDLSRVLGVTENSVITEQDEQRQIEMLAWALANPVGAKKIREQFSIGMDTARWVRRLSIGVRDQWKGLGFSLAREVVT